MVNESLALTKVVGFLLNPSAAGISKRATTPMTDSTPRLNKNKAVTSRRGRALSEPSSRTMSPTLLSRSGRKNCWKKFLCIALPLEWAYTIICKSILNKLWTKVFFKTLFWIREAHFAPLLSLIVDRLIGRKGIQTINWIFCFLFPDSHVIFLK